MQRHELGVDVGDVENRRRSRLLEAQEIGLRQFLLRGEAAERSGAGSADQKASRRRRLQELPAA